MSAPQAAAPPGEPLRVVALIAAFNEGDLIASVVAELVAQGIAVHLLDDGSTDDTVACVEPFLGRGVLAIERHQRRAGETPWASILRRKEELAEELDADWFLHHDADEFRESPWQGVSLRDGLARVDRAGFNAVDFAVLDFWPTHDRWLPGEDVRAAFTRWSPPAGFNQLQIKAWKKTGAPVALQPSGGHEASFAGRRVFPLRFLLRHYPLRGQAHGARKVLAERLPRLGDESAARGWHQHYQELARQQTFLRDEATLRPYDAEAVRLDLVLRHRGVEALEAELTTSPAARERLRQRLDELVAEVAVERQRADRAGLELDRRNRQAEQLGSDLDRRNREADRLARDLDARNREAERLGNVLDARNRDLERALDELAAARSRADNAEARVRELLASRSWRWTAPLRAVLEALR